MVGLLGKGAGLVRHRSQPLRKLISPRSRDQQPFFRPRHPHIEEFHVLGGLGWRETEDRFAPRQKTEEKRALRCAWSVYCGQWFEKITNRRAARVQAM